MNGAPKRLYLSHASLVPENFHLQCVPPVILGKNLFQHGRAREIEGGKLLIITIEEKRLNKCDQTFGTYFEYSVIFFRYTHVNQQKSTLYRNFDIMTLSQHRFQMTYQNLLSKFYLILSASSLEINTLFSLVKLHFFQNKRSLTLDQKWHHGREHL